MSLLNLIKSQFLNLPQWKLRAQMLLGEDLGSTQISIYLFLSKELHGSFLFEGQRKQGRGSCSITRSIVSTQLHLTSSWSVSTAENYLDEVMPFLGILHIVTHPGRDIIAYPYRSNVESQISNVHFAVCHIDRCTVGPTLGFTFFLCTILLIPSFFHRC